MFRLWVVLVILIAVNKRMVYGSSCYKDDGREGTCMELKNCNVSLIAYEKCRLRPDKCDTGFLTAEVCCSNWPYRIRERPIDYSCIMNTYSRRIIGMAVTNLTRYPHAAALGYLYPHSRHYSWECGGALIHMRYVLTAAHCLNLYLKVVLLGASDVLHTSNPYAQIREVEYVLPHEEYQSKHPKKQYNDIGLVRLKKPIEETVYVSPACLLTHSISNGEVSTIGWGVGSYNPTQVTTNQKKILREAEMSVISCPKRRHDPEIKKRNVICAKSEKNAACAGDSGGPLQVFYEKRLYIMGVYSFGPGICKSKTASHFIRLTPFLDWIEKEVWSAERCVYDNKLPQ